MSLPAARCGAAVVSKCVAVCVVSAPQNPDRRARRKDSDGSAELIGYQRLQPHMR